MFFKNKKKKVFEQSFIFVNSDDESVSVTLIDTDLTNYTEDILDQLKAELIFDIGDMKNG